MTHYIIKTWELGEEKPQFVTSFTNRQDAEVDFVDRANRCLYEGSIITFITHRWNYIFKRQDGTQFRLYMYENDKLD